MLKGESFVVLGEEWGFYPTTTQHLLSPLMRENRFLWVHLLGSRRPEWSLYDLKRAVGKISHWTGARKAATPHPPRAGGPPVCSPVLLPFSANPAVRWWNRRSIVRSTVAHLKNLGLSKPIFFASQPNAAEVLGEFDEKLVAYLCFDEHTELPGIHRDYVRDMEEKMLDRADLVLVTAKTLIGKKSRPGKPALLLPQGIEFEHFNRFADAGCPVPDDLADLPRPRFGFVGLLAPWVDNDLLVKLARAHPKASIVLIGPPRADVEALRREGNIHLLGARPYAELPRYLAHFDVGLIPFQLNLLTRYVNPLKLLEYLAAGLPVVSTALPDVVDLFGNLVHCAADADSFIDAVGQALTENTPERRRERMEAARTNSWEQRAEEFSAFVQAVKAKRDAA